MQTKTPLPQSSGSSPLAQRAVLACAPPVVLILLVLGTIYVGVATPTEAGAMGALGSVLLAAARGRLKRGVLPDAALRTALQAVPSIKTGRPKAEAAPAPTPAPVKSSQPSAKTAAKPAKAVKAKAK